MIKKITLWFLLGMILFGLNSCKDFGTPDYTVTIFLGPGVVGTPKAGSYAYKEFDTFSFNYDVIDGAIAPMLTINNSIIYGQQSSSIIGNRTVFTNLNVVVNQTDIRGVWHIAYYNSDNVTKIDEFDITFSGNILNNGTFSDSKGHHGIWKIDTKINLTITYTDWPNYVFSTTIMNFISLSSGTWIDGNGLTGNWLLSKPTT